jgi:hypothetical protein
LIPLAPAYATWFVRTEKSCVGSPSRHIRRTNSEYAIMASMEEGRKRVLAIVAGILVARHLKNPEDLHESRPSPRTESLIASAVQWAERIMRRIDGLHH